MDDQEKTIEHLRSVAQSSGHIGMARLAIESLQAIESLRSDNARLRAERDEAIGERDRLRDAIREHRDARGDDRCWEDDLRLYAALGEGDVDPSASALPPKCDFLASCERYYRQRQAPDTAPADLPDRMTIAQLAEELAQLRRRVDDTEFGPARIGGGS